MPPAAPHPLAQQIAGLTADIRDDAAIHAARRGAVPILHALILLAFAALLDRLENLVRLWQAGLLPVPQPRAPRATPPHREATPPLPRSRAATPGCRASRRATPPAVHAVSAPSPGTPHISMPDATPRATSRKAHVRPIPLTPAIIAFSPRRSPWRLSSARTLNAPNSFRYRNK